MQNFARRFKSTSTKLMRTDAPASISRVASQPTHYVE